MLYFAYGSNLHHFQMKRRCKDSIFIKKINLKDFRLTFRSKYRAADIEPKKNSIVPAGLFEISKKDFDNKNDLFTYTSFKWRITGTRQEVFRVNEITTKNASQILPGIGNELFSLQFWRAPKNSPTTLAKKLDLLR